MDQDEDDEFESDGEEEEGTAGELIENPESSQNEVNFDQLKNFGWNLLTGGDRPLLQYVLNVATTIPHFKNLPT